MWTVYAHTYRLSCGADSSSRYCGVTRTRMPWVTASYMVQSGEQKRGLNGGWGVLAGYLADRSNHTRSGQGGVNISGKIAPGLQANRQAQHAVGDAKLRARLGLQALVGGGGGMRDKALGVAQIVGDPDKPQGVEETEGSRLAALDLE